MRQARPWLGAAALVFAAILALIVLLNTFAPAPQGPADSSYATTPGGVAAWAELLSRSGHPVKSLREPLASAPLLQGSTLIVLGADSLTKHEATHLRDFVQRGGRLLVGGGDPFTVLSALGADPPRWTPSGPTTVRIASSTSETQGVSAVQTAGEGAWRSPSPLLVSRSTGAGRIEMLADSSPLQNQLLASADNAKLALNLAGPSSAPVVFAEAIHGFGRATGLEAIPASWWLMFGLLFAAAATWAVSRGRRLGPPDEPQPALAPARSAYVAGMAGMLLRTRDRDGIARLAGKLVDSEK